MLSKEFENLMDAAGGRYIIVENGKPRYIVMSFEEYKEAIIGKKPIQALTEKELIAKINSDIALWRENNSAATDAVIEELTELTEMEYVP